ncbi:MAG: glycoside hydrolase family 43 protein [Bacteroidales bacterium]|nr:glycoside hydrolase family 43 protein [Candidatus Liminaster caballi]
MKFSIRLLPLTFAAFLSLTSCKEATPSAELPDYGYLYCHMSDYGQWTAFAISRDGLNYEDIIGGDSIFSSYELARIEGGTRDAYITRRAKGQGYLMVTTDMNNSMTRALGKSSDWENFGIDLLTSDDLIHWQSTTFDFRQGPSVFCDAASSPDVYRDWSTICRVWAPQIFWDAAYRWPDGRQGGYFIYYSMLNRPEEGYDRMYYSYADSSFTRMTKPQVLFDWGYATIDADINFLPADGLYHMMIKKEGGKPGLFTATSPSLTGPWGEPVEDDFVSFEGDRKCEGVSAFQLIGEDDWRIAYIEYSSRPKHYRICKADRNMRNFSDPQDIQGVHGPQHGSFMRLTKSEYTRLKAWSDSIMAAKK